MGVSRETLQRLDIYVAELLRWNKKINLISRRDEDQIWDRHILDCLRLTQLQKPEGDWVDIGSGGGLPGLVVACAAGDDPNFRITLIESDARKCAFLREVTRKLQLPVKIETRRIEETPTQRYDVLTARALAALPKLMEMAHSHLSQNGVALFLKGEKADQEIAEAKKLWRFDIESAPSLVTPKGRILIVRNISRA